MDTFVVGQRVRLDADTKEWGRVVGKATIIAVNADKLQVEADDIEATITINKAEAYVPGLWRVSQ